MQAARGLIATLRVVVIVAITATLRTLSAEGPPDSNKKGFQGIEREKNVDAT
jgi:hypothetical protein